MLIPKQKDQQREFLTWLIDVCTTSQDRRRIMYDRRRLYYLFGQNQYQAVKLNKLKSHIGLVSSFLFSADGLEYAVNAPHNADEDQISKWKALADDLNDDVQNFGIADTFAQANLWGLVYDTMFLKVGWNDISKQPFVQLVEPSSLGVFREDIADFSSQPALVHTYDIDWDEAVLRLHRAGMGDRVPLLQASSGDMTGVGRPGSLAQLIVTQSAGVNFANPMIGSFNTAYQSTPTFVADVNNPTVKFHEAHIFDSEENDWRVFTVIQPGIILSDSKDTIALLAKKSPKRFPFESRTNFFLKGEHPFIPVTPYPIYNYFWGDSHLEDLIPLQDWACERLNQIDEILNKQADPARAYTGFSGVADEKFAAMGQHGTWIADMSPTGQIKELYPQMPEDLFAEFNEIQGLFLEQSGLTEILTGKSSGGARGGKQAKQLQVTGGGRVRQVAVGLEGPLARLGDLLVKLKMKNDDTRLKDDKGNEFVASQLEDDFTIRVSGHSQSPLFQEETREVALTLFKAQALDREGLVRALNPATRDNIIHNLKIREKKEQQQKAAMIATGEDPNKKSHKKK